MHTRVLVGIESKTVLSNLSHLIGVFSKDRTGDACFCSITLGPPAAAGAAGQTDRRNLILRPFRGGHWSAEDCPRPAPFVPSKASSKCWKYWKVRKEGGKGETCFFVICYPNSILPIFSLSRFRTRIRSRGRGAVRID